MGCLHYLSPGITLALLGLFTFSSPTITHAQPKTPANLTIVNDLPALEGEKTSVWIQLGSKNIEKGLFLDSGGDVDTEVVSIGSPATEARRTGTGQTLPSPDGNQTPDIFIQFRVADNILFAGTPTTRLRIEVEYFDQGTDTFSTQYDAISGGPYGDGTFKDTGSVTKSNSQQFQTAVFIVCDANFANRDNGADFRIDDHGDGVEIIRRVTITLLPSGPQTINVDSCGANPYDTNPDSDAIQACIDMACNGDTVVFSSGINSPSYQGYRIDKTLFLVATTPKTDLTFRSTNPANHALLQATNNLKGFVVHGIARSRIPNRGEVDRLTLSHLNIDGNRSGRICYGLDDIGNGVGDNWGSWLPECTVAGDPWCSPGSINLCGATDLQDPTQNYIGNPLAWSTGFIVNDVTINNTECGTALGFCGAAGRIKDSKIDIAGDHTHVPSCTQTDADEAMGAWSDGITFEGPGHIITNNIILDASDVGIVFFGGKNTIITNNTVQARAGNYGMFAGIAIHPWGFGDISGSQVINNLVTSTASSNCGGLHTGINIGTHMWGGGCVGGADHAAFGNPNTCTAEPPHPAGTACITGQSCQIWAHVAANKTFTLQNNVVTGAQVNYLIEGLDLVGTLATSNNISNSPMMTDWQNDANCVMGGQADTWTTIHKAAHHPALAGWTDQRIHCER